MSIAEAERWRAPVLNYGPANVDEATAAEGYGRRRLAYGGTPAAPEVLR